MDDFESRLRRESPEAAPFSSHVKFGAGRIRLWSAGLDSLGSSSSSLERTLVEEELRKRDEERLAKEMDSEWEWEETEEEEEEAEEVMKIEEPQPKDHTGLQVTCTC